MLKGIYLGAYKSLHMPYDLIYQDINGKRDLGGDMLDIDLTKFDYVIATPPCNYYSRANYRRETSLYALRTKHLLPCILIKLCSLGKPFIVENVRNDKTFKKFGLFDLPGCIVYRVGRHTYWSNVLLFLDDIKQEAVTDFKNGKKRYLSSQNLPSYARQGGSEVHEVIERFLVQVNG